MVFLNPANHPQKMLALTKRNTVFAAPTQKAAQQHLTPAAYQAAFLLLW